MVGDIAGLVEASEIAALFETSDVVAYRATADDVFIARLLEAERPGTEAMAPRRLAEYATARSAARAALDAVGGTGPIVRRDNGEPIWPDGFTGSIAHTRGHCIAVAAQRRPPGHDVENLELTIGVDVEGIERVNPKIERRVLTDAERQHLHRLPVERHQTFIATVFAAKEAFYKAHHQLRPGYLGFDVVSLALHADGAVTFEHGAEDLAVDVVATTTGRTEVIDGRVHAAVRIHRPVRSTPDTRPVPSAP